MRQQIVSGMAGVLLCVAWLDSPAWGQVEALLSREMDSTRRETNDVFEPPNPLPVTFEHRLIRIDAFKNNSPNLSITFDRAEAVALDPEEIGIEDMSATNALQAASSAEQLLPQYGFWGSNWKNNDPPRAEWNTQDLQVLFASKNQQSFPLVLGPGEFFLVETSIAHLGDAEDAGEAIVGWQFFAVASTVPILPGDTNGDGTVDLRDFSVLRQNFGRRDATRQMGDFDADGAVMLNDFNILKQRFGTSIGDAASVPEPATLVLLICGTPILIGWVRRRFHR